MAISINSFALIFLTLSLTLNLFISLVPIKAKPLEFEMEVNELKMKDDSFFENHINSTFSNIRSRSILPLNVLPQEVLTMKVCIGVPDQCFNAIYDTGSYHLWLPAVNSLGCRSCKSFDDKKSKTFEKQNKNIQLNYITGMASGWEVIDYLKIEDKLQKMYWMLAEFIQFDVEGADGIIGFARDYTESAANFYVSNKYSLVDQLYFSKIIEKRVFSQNFSDKELTKAKLYLGEYTDDFSSYENFTYCHVIKSDPFFAKSSLRNLWTCKLSYVILGKPSIDNFYLNSHEVYSRAVFDSGSNYIMAPFNLVEVFDETFRKIPGCSSNYDSTSGLLIFICKKELDTALVPDLSFIFNGIAYTVPSEKLFKETSLKDEKVVFFTVLFSYNLDFWLLGQYFLRNFHVLFDNERSIIGLKGDKKYITDFTSITDDNDFVFSEHSVLILSIIVVLAILIAIGLYVWSKKNRKERVINQNEVAFTSGILSDGNNYARF